MSRSKKRKYHARVAYDATRQSVTASGAYKTDPIFSAIEMHRRAYAKFHVALKEKSMREHGRIGRVPAAEQRKIDQLEKTFGHAESRAADELVETVPSSLGGALAVLGYVRELTDQFRDAAFELEQYETLLHSIERFIGAHIARGRLAIVHEVSGTAA